MSEEPSETPWIDYVETLVRWRRSIVVAVAVAWSGIAAAALLVPWSYNAEATLSLPPVIPKVKQEEARRVGVPLALYKKLEKLLTSEQVLEEGLKAILKPEEIRALERNLSRHVAPVTTSPLSDIRRMTVDDTVIGIQINYSARPEERAKQVVTALAQLCRNAFVNLLLVEQIDADTAAANAARANAIEDKTELIFLADSLGKQIVDLRRLVQDFPGVGAWSAGQVVETRGEGSHFLPPAVQLVGVRARQAETASRLRVLDAQLTLEDLRLAFLRDLDQQIYADGIERDSRLESDVAAFVSEELKRFVAARSGDPQVIDLLRAEVAALNGTVAGAAATTRFVQLPTARRKSRGVAVLAAAASAVVLAFLGALVGESWVRFHSRTV